MKKLFLIIFFFIISKNLYAEPKGFVCTCIDSEYTEWKSIQPLDNDSRFLDECFYNQGRTIEIDISKKSFNGEKYKHKNGFFITDTEINFFDKENFKENPKLSYSIRFDRYTGILEDWTRYNFLGYYKRDDGSKTGVFKTLRKDRYQCKSANKLL